MLQLLCTDMSQHHAVLYCCAQPMGLWAAWVYHCIILFLTSAKMPCSGPQDFVSCRVRPSGKKRLGTTALHFQLKNALLFDFFFCFLFFFFAAVSFGRNGYDAVFVK